MEEQEESGDIDEAIRYFTNEHANTKVRGNVPLTMALETIEKRAKQSGLSHQHILQISDVTTSARFSDAVNSRLIRSLIPSDTVPIEAIMKTVSWMCTNRPSSSIQSFLVRWMLLVYDVIDDKKKFHCLYSLIFYFLENETLCPHICHLLCLMTQKDDVRLFRVRQLLSYQQRMGNQPYLLGLLSVYKGFCPHLVSLVIPRSQRVFFRQTDRKWASSIAEVQQRRQNISPVDLDRSSLLFLSPKSRSQQRDGPPSKRRKTDLIPVMEECTVNKSVVPVLYDKTTGREEEKIPFVQVKSFKQLLGCLGRVEPPSQMAAVLRNPLLQHVTSCATDPSIPMRLSFWLSHTLYEEFLNNPSEEGLERRTALLKMLVHFSEFMHEIVPVCEDFLHKYLHVWNGSDCRPHVLRLITRLRLYPFPVLNDLLLEPLRKLFFCSSVYFKCQVLVCLTELLRNFVSTEVTRYYKTLEWQQQRDDIATSQADLPKYHCVFHEEVETFCPLECIACVLEYVDSLAVIGLQVERDNTVLLNCVLSLYEMVSSIHQVYGLPLVVLPSNGIICKAVFTNNAAVLSRICDIICSYKNAFLSVRSQKENFSPAELNIRSKSLQQVSRLNTFILCISNMLWRYRSFSSADGKMLFPHLDHQQLQSLGIEESGHSFSIHQHVALLGFVWYFLDQTQPEGSHVHPSAIKHNRDTYMEFLEQEQVSGILNFIRTFIRRKSAK